MEATRLWTEETQVRLFETDFQKRWKASAFFAALQEAASVHASRLGYDYREMLTRNQAWIISRLKIRFEAFPLTGETVNIRTWPKGIQQRLFFVRDFELTGGAGQMLARATAAYLLVDTSARRILAPRALGGELPLNENLHALEETLEKLEPPDQMEAVFTMPVRYSAVDLMEHVNNTRYVEWVTDCFSFEEHRQQRLASIQMNYINEVRPGEQVELRRGQRVPGSGVWYVTGENRTTQLRAFEAAVEWHSAEGQQAE
jgi:medium-chain acyl-[acyl-carrier-protein] hydrolase